MSTDSPKYVIFHTGTNSGSETTPMVLYDSVKVETIQQGNTQEVFRVYSNVSETERLFREKEGSPIQYMKIVRQPSMELATLPPPRSNILYLITEYETIHDPLFTMLANQNILVYARKDDDFKTFRESLKSMEHHFNEQFEAGKKDDVLKMIHVGVNISDSYVLSPASSEDESIDKPRSLHDIKAKSLMELLHDIHSRSSGWSIVLDVNNQLSGTTFNRMGLNLTSESLSLDPKHPTPEQKPADEPVPTAPPVVDYEPGKVTQDKTQSSANPVEKSV